MVYTSGNIDFVNFKVREPLKKEFDKTVRNSKTVKIAEVLRALMIRYINDPALQAVINDHVRQNKTF